MRGSPKLILGAVLGPSAVGIYMVARRPVELLSNAILGPISGVVMPAVYRLQTDKAKLDLFFEKSLRGTMLAGFPAFVGGRRDSARHYPAGVWRAVGEQHRTGSDYFAPWAGAQRGWRMRRHNSRIRAIAPMLLLNIIYSFIAAAAILFTARMSIEATMVAIVACNVVLVPPLLYYVHQLASIDVLKPLRMLPRLVLATLAMLIAVATWRHLLGNTRSLIVLLSAIVFGGLTYAAAVIVLLRPELLSARDLIVKARG